MRNLYRALGLLLTASLLTACTQNPLGPTPSSSAVAPTTRNLGVAEPLSSAVLYAPETAAAGTHSYTGFNPDCVPADASTFGGGAITVAAGGNSSGHFAVLSPGIGGPAGDFQASYFGRWTGVKGPNASSDYNNLFIPILSQSAPVNLSCYRGFTFYARGHGDFGLQLAATGSTTGTVGPYTNWNYYEYVFGPQLSATVWKQFIVNFTDLQQLYGSAVNLNAVIAHATGFNVTQESPYVRNFSLDLDYIRFF